MTQTEFGRLVWCECPGAVSAARDTNPLQFEHGPLHPPAAMEKPTAFTPRAWQTLPGFPIPTQLLLATLSCSPGTLVPLLADSASPELHQAEISALSF